MVTLINRFNKKVKKICLDKILLFRNKILVLLVIIVKVCLKMEVEILVLYMEIINHFLNKIVIILKTVILFQIY
jgi:hypothetical protein